MRRLCRVSEILADLRFADDEAMMMGSDVDGLVTEMKAMRKEMSALQSDVSSIARSLAGIKSTLVKQ